MRYAMQIIRDEAVLFEKEISADLAIDLLTSSDLTTEEEEEVEEEIKKPVPAAKKVTGGKRKNKPATCGKCGKVGHRADHCKKASDLFDEADNEDTSSSEEEIDEDKAIAEGAIDRVRYTQVKECKHKEMNSKETADELDLDPDEVRIAFGSATYEGYLRLR